MVRAPIFDQSKTRMRSAISPLPTSHSLDSSSERASLRNAPPGAARSRRTTRPWPPQAVKPFLETVRGGDSSLAPIKAFNRAQARSCRHPRQVRAL